MSVRKRTWTTAQGVQQEAWIVDYRAGDGRHLRTFTRKKDADAFAATATVDVSAGTHTTSKKTVAQAAALWLTAAEHHGLERTTVEMYASHVEHHINPRLGAVKLNQVTVPLVSDYRAWLRANGRSPAMVKKILVSLGSILAEAQERGLVGQNVVRGLKRRKSRDAERRQKGQIKAGVDIPTPDEIRAVLSQLEGRWRPILLTAIFTGLRASELRGLAWAAVDLKKAELHVRQRADRFNAIGKPKSASGERVVPLPPMVLNALREWKLACPKSELGLAFPTAAGTVTTRNDIVRRGFLAGADRCGRRR